MLQKKTYYLIQLMNKNFFIQLQAQIEQKLPQSLYYEGTFAHPLNLTHSDNSTFNFFGTVCCSLS